MSRFIARAGALNLLLLAVLLAPLFVHAYNGSFSRFIADDYCMAASVQEFGLVSYAQQIIGPATGRYSQILVYGAAVMFGPSVSSLLPALLIAAWLATLIWTVYQMAHLFSLARPLLAAALLAVALVYAALDGAPALIQSLYWTSGAISYLAPLILFTLLLGMLLRCARQGKCGLLAISTTGALAFAAGGFSEPYLMAQGAALALLLPFAWFAPRGRAVLPPLLAALASTAAALFVMVVIGSGGNAARQSNFVPITEPGELAASTLVYSAAYFAQALAVFMPLGLLAVLSVAILVLVRFRTDATPRLTPTQVRRLLALSGGGVFALITAWALPGIYATSGLPPGRAYIIPAFGLALAAALWGALMALGYKPRSAPRRVPWALLALALIIAVGPLLAAGRWLGRSADFAVYAAAWDAQHARITAAVAQGEMQITISVLPVDMGVLAGLENLGPDADALFNVCAARYYRLDSLAVGRAAPPLNKFAGRVSAGVS